MSFNPDVVKAQGASQSSQSQDTSVRKVVPDPSSQRRVPVPGPGLGAGAGAGAGAITPGASVPKPDIVNAEVLRLVGRQLGYDSHLPQQTELSSGGPPVLPPKPPLYPLKDRIVPGSGRVLIGPPSERVPVGQRGSPLDKRVQMGAPKDEKKG